MACLRAFYSTSTRVCPTIPLGFAVLISHRNQDLNAVCDISCRDNSALMFVDPQTGLIVIVDGNATGKRKYVVN